jgi:hypothetical protein
VAPSSSYTSAAFSYLTIAKKAISVPKIFFMIKTHTKQTLNNVFSHFDSSKVRNARG